MVKELDVFKTRAVVVDSDFDIKSFYKIVKSKAQAMDYVFFEKLQTSKPEKYGDEVEFKMQLARELDDFCSAEINIEGFFYDLERSKGKEHGSMKATIKAKIVLDFRNRWGKNSFSRFLFGIYFLMNKREYENKYFVPVYKSASELHNAIKENLGLETA